MSRSRCASPEKWPPLTFCASALKPRHGRLLTTLLIKRRGQLKQAVTAIVQQAKQYIDETPDVDIKIELIKTLNNVSAGKIYVEIERARLIKRLAKIKEEQGLIAEAADLMQEIVVETFGAMAKTEKIAFILEQTVRILFVLRSYQGKSVQEFLMQILQKRRKNLKKVTVLLRRLLLHSIVNGVGAYLP